MVNDCDVRLAWMFAGALAQVVSEHWAGSAQEVREAVVRAAREFIGAQTVYDDLTLLVVKQR